MNETVKNETIQEPLSVAKEVTDFAKVLNESVVVPSSEGKQDFNDHCEWHYDRLKEAIFDQEKLIDVTVLITVRRGTYYANKKLTKSLLHHDEVSQMFYVKMLDNDYTVAFGKHLNAERFFENVGLEYPS